MSQIAAQVFLPLFVAMSVPTIAPIFLSLTHGMSPEERSSLAKKGTITAAVVAALVTLGGQLLFRLLGITVNDLRVGGGIILLVLSIYDLVFSKEERRVRDAGDLGVVPLGVPLIVGPATMTTLLVLADGFGRGPVFVALVINLLLIGLVMSQAQRLVDWIGEAGVRAFGKVMSLFMTAIAVAMIRAGLLGFLVEAGIKLPG